MEVELGNNYHRPGWASFKRATQTYWVDSCMSTMDKNIPIGPKCGTRNQVSKHWLHLGLMKLKKFKISAGLHLQNLKNGKDISYKSKKYKVKDLTFKDEDKKNCLF